MALDGEKRGESQTKDKAKQNPTATRSPLWQRTAEKRGKRKDEPKNNEVSSLKLRLPIRLLTARVLMV